MRAILGGFHSPPLDAPMPDRTAQTRIDVGSATVANAWCARTWSAFLGGTVGLRHTTTGTEWIARQAPDFALRGEDPDGQGLALGSPSWSEEANPHGATLQAEFDRDGIVARWRCFAFHEAPAMLRALAIHNYTNRPCDIGPVTLERVAPVAGARATPFADRAIHLAGPEAAWIVAAEAPASTPDGSSGCATRVDETRTLAPGAAWSLPEVAWVACADPTPEAAQAAWGAYLRARRALRAWLESRQAAQAGDAANN